MTFVSSRGHLTPGATIITSVRNLHKRDGYLRFTDLFATDLNAQNYELHERTL